MEFSSVATPEAREAVRKLTIAHADEQALALAPITERTGPFRSAIPIDPDQWFRLIPITHSGRSRSVCGEV
jgi:hypothetical protein